MNTKLFKKLAEQAETKELGYYFFDKEKFAELIVRECAQLVKDNMDPQNAWITPSYVKQHFGVKE
jgi:hypothetical protein